MPRSRPCLLAIASVVTLLVAAHAEDTKSAPPAATPVDIERLVKQLSGDGFDQREATSKALGAIGEAALEALRAAAKSGDAEVRRRAEEIIRAVESRRCLKGHAATVCCVAFNTDGRRVLSYDGLDIRVWDVKERSEVRCIKLPDKRGRTKWLSYGQAKFSPDGRQVLAGCNDGTMRLWDVQTGKRVRCLTVSPDSVWAVDFAADGKKMISATRDTIRIWDTGTGKELVQFQAHTVNAMSIAVSPDGNPLLTGSTDQEVRLWDVATGKQLRSFKCGGKEVRCMDWSRDGKRALICSDGWALRLWDVESGKELRRFEDPKDSAEGAYAHTAVFATDGRRLLANSGGTVRLWEAETGKQLQSFRSPYANFGPLAISPDGKWFVLADQEGGVHLEPVPACGRTGRFN